MEKVILVGVATVTLALSGCATQGSGSMSRGEQAAVGAGAGALIGGLIGGLLGGGKGAAIGAAGGALLAGAATYALASDPFTQSATRQAETFQRDMSAQTNVVKASTVVENGQSKQKIDIQKTLIPERNMQSGGQLTSKARETLSETVREVHEVGGDVLVICPADASSTVLHDIAATGAKTQQDWTLKGGYTIIVSRNAKDLVVS